MSMPSAMVVLTGLLAVTSSAVTSSAVTLAKWETHNWCGKQLVEMLQVVCRGKYNQPTFRLSSGDEADSLKQDFNQHRLFLFPLRRQVRDMLLRTEDKDGGVSEECCRRGCTIAILKTYCEK